MTSLRPSTGRCCPAALRRHDGGSAARSLPSAQFTHFTHFTYAGREPPPTSSKQTIRRIRCAKRASRCDYGAVGSPVPWVVDLDDEHIVVVSPSGSGIDGDAGHANIHREEGVVVAIARQIDHAHGERRALAQTEMGFFSALRPLIKVDFSNHVFIEAMRWTGTTTRRTSSRPCTIRSRRRKLAGGRVADAPLPVTAVAHASAKGHPTAARDIAKALLAGRPWAGRCKWGRRGPRAIATPVDEETTSRFATVAAAVSASAASSCLQSCSDKGTLAAYDVAHGMIRVTATGLLNPKALHMAHKSTRSVYHAVSTSMRSAPSSVRHRSTSRGVFQSHRRSHDLTAVS